MKCLSLQTAVWVVTEKVEVTPGPTANRFAANAQLKAIAVLLNHAVRGEADDRA